VTDAHPHELGLLAKLVIAITLLMIVAGTLWHGITADTFQRIWRNLVDRPSGPMSFRFILQPSMAAIAAIYDGLKDARRNRTPYFSTILWNPQKRVGRLREGLNAIARIMLLCIAMDAIYQVLALDTFHPSEAVIVALLLAFLPYVVIRGSVTRAALWWRGRADDRLKA